ncbi:MAG: VWA domain-containing protein [Sandaracinus sp.]|nr:VWA domain-containing protein [Sandaracinus sp.]MCB9620560.1 VWA domain-containing protein [Sandaracinus sp.]MCB9635349.1 VWA domain-containing protein [Sandaracinus sp.]
MAFRRWVLALVVLAGACGDEPRRRPPVGGDGGVDAGAALRDASFPDVPPVDGGVCMDAVDVVFVLDVSSSMNFVLEELEDDVQQVVDAATALAPDPHFGFLGFVDNHAFAANGSLEGGRVHTSAATLQAAFREFLSTYTSPNRNPGDGPSGPTTQNPICEENALDAIHAAATEFPWRESATRVIIVATDDTFLIAPDNYGDRDGDGDWTSTDFPREGNYPARRGYAETVTAVQEARARVFAFTRLTAPDVFSRCGTGRRLGWSQITEGWSAPYQGAEPIPSATDGQNFDLAAVQAGRLSLAATINEVVVESYCQPPLF